MDIFVVDNERQLQKVNQVSLWGYVGSGMVSVKGLVSVLDTTGPSSQHKGYLFAQRDRWQGIRDKDRRERRREKGKGTRKRGQGYLP